MKLSLDIKNISEVSKIFDKFGKEAEQSIKEAIVKQAFETTDDAKKLAPVDLGHLKQNIVPRKVDDFSWSVISYAKYSPYMEFGTGKMVQVPQELYDIAIQFKGKGIREVNIPPQPFMYPAFVKARSGYKENLKKALQKLIDKNNGTLNK